MENLGGDSKDTGCDCTWNAVSRGEDEGEATEAEDAHAVIGGVTEEGEG